MQRVTLFLCISLTYAWPSCGISQPDHLPCFCTGIAAGMTHYVQSVLDRKATYSHYTHGISDSYLDKAVQFTESCASPFIMKHLTDRCIAYEEMKDSGCARCLKNINNGATIGYLIGAVPTLIYNASASARTHDMTYSLGTIASAGNIAGMSFTWDDGHVYVLGFDVTEYIPGLRGCPTTKEIGFKEEV